MISQRYFEAYHDTDRQLRRLAALSDILDDLFLALPLEASEETQKLQVVSGIVAETAKLLLGKHQAEWDAYRDGDGQRTPA